MIDYENVHGDGLVGCDNLKKEDHIIIFFTDNAKQIDMSCIFRHGDATLEMKKVVAGKQSTDMHIASYVGFLAGKYGKECNIVIVSKDGDYDNVLRFWEESMGLQMMRAPSIRDSIFTVVDISCKQKAKMNQETIQVVRMAGFDASLAKNVAQIASTYYGNEHMMVEVHNELRKQYLDYLEIYKVIKPALSKYAAG